ncbi:MAG: hypothetical protein FD164_2041, partial [Nitrospirae bacterium]
MRAFTDLEAMSVTMNRKKKGGGMTFFQKIEMDTAGSLYRSAMPFGTYDKSGDLFSEYLMQGIATVVLLAGD